MGQWIHTHDWLQIGATTPGDGEVVDYVKEIRVDDLWKLTLYISSNVAEWGYIEGIPGSSFFAVNTSEGVGAPAVYEVGGAEIGNAPVLMRGMIKVRFLEPMAFVIKREWITWEQ